jgi:hypothetical protein
MSRHTWVYEMRKYTEIWGFVFLNFEIGLTPNVFNIAWTLKHHVFNWSSSGVGIVHTFKYGIMINTMPMLDNGTFPWTSF